MKTIHRIGTIDSQENEMEKSLKPLDTEIEETIKSQEDEMKETNGLMEDSMEGTNNTQEENTENSPNLTNEIAFVIDVFPLGFEPLDEIAESPEEIRKMVDANSLTKEKLIETNHNLWELFESFARDRKGYMEKLSELEKDEKKDTVDGVDGEVGEKAFLEKEEMEIINHLKDDLKEDKEEEDQVFFYWSFLKESAPYTWELDPGVPAPLRRLWMNVDVEIRHKYWGMKRCYVEYGEFDLSMFLSLWKDEDEKTKKEFLDLAKENKELALKELERCYEQNGGFSYVKFDSLLQEEKKYLKERIKKTVEQLKSLRKRFRENKLFDNETKSRLGYQGHQIRYKEILEDEVMTKLHKPRG